MRNHVAWVSHPVVQAFKESRLVGLFASAVATIREKTGVRPVGRHRLAVA